MAKSILCLTLLLSACWSQNGAAADVRQILQAASQRFQAEHQPPPPSFREFLQSVGVISKEVAFGPFVRTFGAEPVAGGLGCFAVYYIQQNSPMNAAVIAAAAVVASRYRPVDKGQIDRAERTLSRFWDSRMTAWGFP